MIQTDKGKINTTTRATIATIEAAISLFVSYINYMLKYFIAYIFDVSNRSETILKITLNDHSQYHVPKDLF